MMGDQEVQEIKDEKYMSIWDHLGELKNRVKTSLIVFIVTFFGFFLLSDRLLNFLWGHFIGQYHLTLLSPSLMSGFVTQLDFALILAATYSLPVFIYEMFAFIDPAISSKHRNIALKVIFSATCLFIAGVAFVYFVMLPLMIEFFVNTNTNLGLSNFFTVESFFEFIMINLFLGGICFQTPLIIVMFNKVGLLPKEWLIKFRSYVYVAILVVGGIMTPDHSIISQLLLGGMMILLFELGLLFCK